MRIGETRLSKSRKGKKINIFGYFWADENERISGLKEYLSTFSEIAMILRNLTLGLAGLKSSRNA